MVAETNLAVSAAADDVVPVAASASAPAAALEALVARAADLVRANLREQELHGYCINDEAIDLSDFVKSRQRGRSSDRGIDPLDALLHAGVFELENEWDENGADWTADRDDEAVAEARADVFQNALAADLQNVADLLAASGERDSDFGVDELEEELHEHESLARENVLDYTLHGTRYTWQGHIPAQADLGASISLGADLMEGLAALRITPTAFLAGLATLSDDELPFATAQALVPAQDAYRPEGDPADPVSVAIAAQREAAQKALDAGDSRGALLRHFEAELAAAARTRQLERGDPWVFDRAPAVDPAALCRALFLNYEGKPAPLDGSTELRVAVRLESDYIENVSRAVARQVDGNLNSVRVEARSGVLYFYNDVDRQLPVTGGIEFGMTDLALGDDNVVSMCYRKQEDDVVPAGAFGAKVRLYEVYLDAIESGRQEAARTGNLGFDGYGQDARKLPWDRWRMTTLFADLDERFLPDSKHTTYRVFAKELRAERRTRGTASALGHKLLVVLAAGGDAAQVRGEAIELIARGADLSVRSPAGNTAVHYAAARLDPELLRTLHGADADFTAVVHQAGAAETAFHLALRASEKIWRRSLPVAVIQERIREAFEVLATAGVPLPAVPYFESTTPPIATHRNVLATLGLVAGPTVLGRFIDCARALPPAQLDQALVHAALDGVVPAVTTLLAAGAAPDVRWPTKTSPSLDAQVRGRFLPTDGNVPARPLDGASPETAGASITRALAAARARRAAEAALHASPTAVPSP